MGSAVTARCQCGVETDILIGGGMDNFMTTCYFPCLCESCQNVVQVNLLAKPIKCPECGAHDPIPYDDLQLLGTPGNREVAGWNVKEKLGRELVLTDGKYKCPKCGQMSLEFSNDLGLCWD